MIFKTFFLAIFLSLLLVLTFIFFAFRALKSLAINKVESQILAEKTNIMIIMADDMGYSDPCCMEKSRPR